MAFIDFVDKSMQRFAIHMGTPAPSAMALKEHWDMIGEEQSMEGLRPLARILQDMDVLRA